jgi:hypothetical protein
MRRRDVTIFLAGAAIVGPLTVRAQQPLKVHRVGTLWVTSPSNSGMYAEIYVSSDTPSPFVAREVNASMQAGKPTLVIASDEFESIIGVDSVVPVTRINTEDPTGISVALKMLKLPSGNSA